MFSLSAANAAEYLKSRQWPGAESARITELGGGVSNTVLLVESEGRRIVCKQALEKLRVEEDWRSRPDRTLREADALIALAPLLPERAVPPIVFIDRENLVYAMTASPSGTRDWKANLLQGQIDPSIGAQAGDILGSIVGATWNSQTFEKDFGDQTVFDELRLDPYYRFTASRHSSCAQHFDALITRCRENRVSIVHGDWSPKNLLIHEGSVTAIDFEVVHFGDPCFDTGFLINHLVLKSIHNPAAAPALKRCAMSFWAAFEQHLPAGSSWALPGTIDHLSGLLLARVDGKSPAEYLTAPQRETARRLATAWIANPPVSLELIWKCL